MQRLYHNPFLFSSFVKGPSVHWKYQPEQGTFPNPINGIGWSLTFCIGRGLAGAFETWFFPFLDPGVSREITAVAQ